MTDNRQWVLRRRPVGMVRTDDFELRVGDVPEPAAGQFLVRNRYLSLEPAMRGWIADEPNYLPPVEIGAVMRSLPRRFTRYSPGRGTRTAMRATSRRPSPCSTATAV